MNRSTRNPRHAPTIDEREGVIPTLDGFAGAPRGFGGGRYAAPYSGSYGGEFRTDYRGIRSEGSGRFAASKSVRKPGEG